LQQWLEVIEIKLLCLSLVAIMLDGCCGMLVFNFACGVQVFNLATLLKNIFSVLHCFNVVLVHM
jgi:hypothetical protein